MTNRICLMALAAALALAGLAQSAEASTHWQRGKSPGCISDAEWDGLKLNPAVTRNEMEHRFHVADVRVNVTPLGEHHRFFVYPVCGRPFDRVQAQITLERDNRPGFDRSKKTNGQRVIVGGIWWYEPEGVCKPDAIRECYLPPLSERDGVGSDHAPGRIATHIGRVIGRAG